MEAKARDFADKFALMRKEVGKFIVGQDEVVENVLIAILCGGHVLLEGVPGLGKTALVNTLAQALDLKFGRIQFTPDLLPSDVVGTQILTESGGQRALEFQPGPVFCNILLADEINRATPKTQSALLETMQEKRVTVSNQTHTLEAPFFVLATQNPIENDGTYPLPEAQLDRFFFKLEVPLPSHDEFSEILNRTGGNAQPKISAVVSGPELISMGEVLRQIPIENSVQDFLVLLGPGLFSMVAIMSLGRILPRRQCLRCAIAWSFPSRGRQKAFLLMLWSILRWSPLTRGRFSFWLKFQKISSWWVMTPRNRAWRTLPSCSG